MQLMDDWGNYVVGTPRSLAGAIRHEESQRQVLAGQALSYKTIGFLM
jgi:hypothetical protein